MSSIKKKSTRFLAFFLAAVIALSCVCVLPGTVAETSAAAALAAVKDTAVFNSQVPALVDSDVSIPDEAAFDISDAEVTSGTLYTSTSGAGWVYDADAETGIDDEIGAIYWNSFSSAKSTSAENEYYVTTSKLSLKWSGAAQAVSGTETISLDVELTIGSFDLYYYGSEDAVSENGKTPTERMGVLYNSKGTLWLSTKRVNYSGTVMVYAAEIPVTITFYYSGTDTVYDGTYVFYASDVDQPSYYNAAKYWGQTYNFYNPLNYGAENTGLTGACELAEAAGWNLWNNTVYQESWYINSGNVSSTVYLYSNSYLKLSSNRIYGSIQTDDEDYMDGFTYSAFQIALETGGASLTYSGSSCGSQLFQSYDIDMGTLAMEKTGTDSDGNEVSYSTYSLEGAVYAVYDDKTNADGEKDAIAYFLVSQSGWCHAASTTDQGLTSGSTASVTYTDASGTSVTLYYSGIYTITLPVGTYYIREVRAPSDGSYSLDSTVYPVTVSKDTAASKKLTDVLATSYTLRLKKTAVDSDGNAVSDTSAAPLTNALYKVTDSSGTAVGYFITGTDYGGYAYGYAATTDKDEAYEPDTYYVKYGSVTYYAYMNSSGYPVAHLDLAAGTYSVSELAAPEGYYRDTDIADVVFTSGSEADFTIESEDTIKNGYLMVFKAGLDTDGSVLVGVADDGSESPWSSNTVTSSSYSLYGAMYGLYASKDDAYADENPIAYYIISASGWGYVATVQSGGSISAVHNGVTYYSSGTYYKALPLGTYYLKEVEAPSSGQFAADESVKTVKVTSSSEYTVEYAEDSLIYGYLRLIKEGDNESGCILSNALYKVTDSAGTAVGYFITGTDKGGYAYGYVATTDSGSAYEGEYYNVDYGGSTYYAYTDSSGNPTTYMKLAAGTYTITEVAAPEGYELDTTVYTRTISSAWEVTDLIESYEESAVYPVALRNFTSETYASGSGSYNLFINTANGYYLEGAVYAIYDTDWNYMGYVTCTDQGGTNSYNPSVYAESDTIYLAAGSYYVRAYSASDGYLLTRNSTASNGYKYSAYITVAESDSVQYFNVYEDIDTDVIPDLYKVDEDGNRIKESGIIFKVVYSYISASGSTARRTLYYETDEDGMVDFSSQDYLSGSYTSSPFVDSSGNIIFGQGTVTVTEISGTAGYQVNDTVLTVTLTLASDGSLSASYSEDVVNSKNVIVFENAKMAIDTVLLDDASGTHYAEGDGTLSLTDTVSYENFTVGETYIVRAYLYDTDEGTYLKDDNGNRIMVMQNFVCTEASGTFTVEYSSDAVEYAKGHTLVSYIFVYDSDMVFQVSHADKSDTDQTVYVTSVETELINTENSSHVAMADGQITLTDTVTYGNYPESWWFKFTGRLYDVTTGAWAVDDSGNAITASKNVYTSSSDGSVELTYSFSGESLAGHTLVSYLTVETGSGYEWASEADADDEDQTVYLPGLDTVLTGTDLSTKIFKTTGSLTLTDTVTAAGIPAGSWKLVMTLVNKEDPTDTVTFTGGGSLTFYTSSNYVSTSLTKTVSASFDCSAFNSFYVAYEELYYSVNGTWYLVASHEEIDDEDQTAEIRATADIIVYKVDSEDKKTPVEGAVYELYNSDNELVCTFTTDENGSSGLIEDLTMGDYCFYETEASSGYTIDGTVHSFTVDASNVGTVIEIYVTENELLIMPSTGGGGIYMYIGLSCLTFISAGLAFVFCGRRKRKSI